LIPRRSWRQSAANHPLAKAVRHPVVTLSALSILFALIFSGTLYQTEHGLYEAQKKFFGYGMVLVGGVFPLPSASVVIWILSIQLAATMVLVLPWKPSKLGLWLSHAGLLALLIGGFITQTRAVESRMTLAEGEEGHFTTAYQDWELAFWETRGDTNAVFAYDAISLPAGREIALSRYGCRLRLRLYYPNCDAFAGTAGNQPPFLNPSGVALIERRKPEKEAVENIPGILFTLAEAGKADREILLYGGEPRPLPLILQGRRVFCQLRLKHYPLDFSLKLTDFVKTVHPGTRVASSFASHAELKEGGSVRPVRIWMNNPLRYRGYTFFQSSYSQPEGAAEKSTFAVVTNPGRTLPYVSSLAVFAGLLLHFLLRFVPFLRREAP
jgi:hypothetical protein